MKRTRWQTNLNFGRLFCLFLLMLTAAISNAQQEVDPDHFDETTVVPSRPPSPHRKPTKTKWKHTRRKTASSTASANFQKSNPPAQNNQPAVGFDKTAEDQGRK